MKNYIEKLQHRVDLYKNKYKQKPRKMAFKLFWWNFKCLFKKYENNLKVDKKYDFLIDYIPTPDDEKLSIYIVAVDSIGDYFMLRNYFEALRLDSRFKNAKITFIGSKTCASFAEFLDAGIIDKFVWLPHWIWEKNLKLISSVRDNFLMPQISNYCDILLLPSVNNVYRMYFYNTLLSKIYAKNSYIHIAYPNSNNDCSAYLDYNHSIVNFTAKKNFEFKNNGYFFERSLNVKTQSDVPFIINKEIKKYKAANKYVVICLGAQAQTRKWHINNWCELIRFFHSKKLDVKIVGGKDDISQCELIEKILKVKIDIHINLPVEKLLNLLNNAELFIGNDSGIFHISAALQTKSIAISSSYAFAFYRFMGYPEKDYVKICRPFQTQQYVIQNFDTDTEIDSKLNIINSVEYSDVIKICSELLESK